MYVHTAKLCIISSKDIPPAMMFLNNSSNGSTYIIYAYNNLSAILCNQLYKTMIKLNPGDDKISASVVATYHDKREERKITVRCATRISGNVYRRAIFAIYCRR